MGGRVIRVRAKALLFFIARLMTERIDGLALERSEGAKPTISISFFSFKGAPLRGQRGA